MRYYIANQQLLCAFSKRGCPFNIGCQKFNNTKFFIHIITGRDLFFALLFWPPLALLCFKREEIWNIYFPGDALISFRDNFWRVWVLCAERSAISMTSLGVSCLSDKFPVVG